MRRAWRGAISRVGPARIRSAPGEEAGAGSDGGFRVGDWWVRPSEGLLLREGRREHLPPQQMDLLAYLASRPGRVVTKEEIFAALWQDSVVEEGAIPRCVSELRKTLGDDVRFPRYIRTVPKKGYRLIAPVSRAEPAPAAPARAGRLKWWAAGATIALVLAALGFRLARRSEQPAAGPTGAGASESPAATAAPATAAGPAGLAHLPRSPSAARLYFDGLAKLRRFEAREARELLERSIEEEPNQPHAHLFLAEAWWVLGNVQKAVEVAARAMELAEGLPREQLLWIEAGYHAVSYRWQEAIDLYRALSVLAPGNLEYGLSLASAQIESSRPDKALATLKELGEGSDPRETDPRFDLLAAEAAARLGDFEQGLAAASRAAERGAALGADLIVARARALQASALLELGKVDEGLTALEEARSSFRAAGDRRSEAAVQRREVGWMLDRGDLAQAERLAREVLAACREIGDLSGEADALKQLAGIRQEMNDQGTAEALYRESLATFRRIGDRSGEAAVLVWMATLAGYRGDYEAAQPLFEQALGIYRATDNRAQVAAMLANLGKLHLHRAEPDAAAQKLREAEAVAREGGRRSVLGNIQFNLGYASAQAGNPAAARDAFAEAVETFRGLENRRMVAASLNGLGEVQAMLADFEAARANLEEALELRLEMGHPGRIAASRVSMAELLIELGDLEGAERQAHLALEAARAGDARLHIALGSLARVLLAQERLQEAQEALRQAEEALAAAPASKVSAQNLWITSARIQAAAGSGKSARSLLEQVVTEAEEEVAWGIRAEAELALGEVELLLGDTAGAHARLLALESEARQHRWKLIADKAHALRKELR